MSKVHDKYHNTWTVTLRTNPENYLEWAENVVTSAVARYGLAHGKAIETGSFDHVIIDPVKIRELCREQREKLP